MGKIFKNVPIGKMKVFEKEIRGCFTIPAGIVTTKALIIN